jgi:YlmC/YmxH family sporulation protein
MEAMKMRISDLQQKDVVNIIDGKKLGHVTDVDFDMQHGRIEALFIPNEVRFFGFLGGGTELMIEWQQIVKIGTDVILVRLHTNHSNSEQFEQTIIEPIKPVRKV